MRERGSEGEGQLGAVIPVSSPHLSPTAALKAKCVCVGGGGSGGYQMVLIQPTAGLKACSKGRLDVQSQPSSAAWL